MRACEDKNRIIDERESSGSHKPLICDNICERHLEESKDSKSTSFSRRMLYPIDKGTVQLRSHLIPLAQAIIQKNSVEMETAVRGTQYQTECNDIDDPSDSNLYWY